MKRILIGFGVLVLLSGGCATSEESAPSPTPTEYSSEIDVTLKEFSIAPDPKVGAEGEVTFSVENTGKETHEFVVARSDSDPAELPRADDGSVDEEQIDVAGEIEDLEAGKSDEVTIDLVAGKYVLFCNVVEEEDGEVEAHYKLGMRTAFTVR